MKKAHKIINSGSRKTYSQLKFKTSVGTTSFEEFAKVIKEINILRCQDIVDSDGGHPLPSNLGKLIILGSKPRVKALYSMTQPGTRIYNHHSFGLIFRCYHKERILMRYSELYNWRSHRENIKKQIYKHVVEQTKTYYKHSDFY